MTLQFLKSILLALLLSAPAFAQNADEAAETRFFDVEIVIFKNLKVPRSREFVLPAGSPAPADPMLDLSSAQSIAAAAEQGYELLPAEQLRLGEIVGRLEESERYDVLVHTAWRQPGVSLEQALPVWIRGGQVYGNEYMSIDSRVRVQQQLDQVPPAEPVAEPQAVASEPSLEPIIEPALNLQPISPGELYELEGKITIALGRFLHTYADLVLRRPRRAAETLPERPTQASQLASADNWILNNHHLREHRRMRSRNLHYLDHPEFSLLVLINRYEPGEPAGDRLPDEDTGIVLDTDLTPTEAEVTTQDQ